MKKPNFEEALAEWGVLVETANDITMKYEADMEPIEKAMEKHLPILKKAIGDVGDQNVYDLIEQEFNFQNGIYPESFRKILDDIEMGEE